MRAFLLVALGLVACVIFAARDAWAALISLGLSPRFRLSTFQEGLTWTAAYYLMWALLTPLVFLFARRVPFRRTAWVGPLLFHLAAGIVIAAAAPVLLAVLFGGLVLGRGWPSLASMLTPFWLDMAAYRAVADVSIYWFVLGAGVGLAYYDAGREKQLQAADLERSLTDAQLEALRMKLQPHFLFNTLNSIAFLALEKDASAIETMVERLGHLLRASVRGHGRQVVTLAEELRLLDQYLAIEELRFKDRLRVTRRIDPSTARARVPSLFLQPIVENSIKHGFSSRIDASCLEITTKVESDALVVLVEDDGPGLPAGWTLDTHCGRGLKNVLQRLDMLYRDRWSFTLRNRPTGGAIAEVRIPLDAGDRSTVGGQ